MKKIFLGSFLALVLYACCLISVSFAESSVNQVFPISHTLSFGMVGSEVASLQQILKDLGYFSYPIITQRFGQITKNAVMAFQKVMNSKTDGIVGPITRLNLETTHNKNREVVSTLSQTSSTTVWLPRKAGVTETGGSSSGTSSDTSAPTIAITTPTDNYHFSSTSISFQSTATDNIAVVGVQYKIDGVNAGTELTTAPYFLSWNDALATQGAHVITAIARDAAGNKTTSAPITYYIDTIAPVVTITSPTGTSLTNNPATLSADVAEDQGIETVVMKVYEVAPPNTIVYSHTLTSAPYSTNWSNGVPDGDYIIEITATDIAGNVGVATKVVTITAAPSTYNLTVNKLGGGLGLVTSVPAGIVCGATCVASYSSGAVVTLMASSAVDSVFSGWSGACNGTGACVISLDGDTSVTATFTQIP